MPRKLTLVLAVGVLALAAGALWSASLDSSPYVHLRRLLVTSDGNPVTGTNPMPVAGVGAGEVALDANAWTAISATIPGRLCLLRLRTTVSGGTAVGTLYGATTDGNTSWPVVDWAGDPIQGRTLTCHVVLDPNGTWYETSIGFVRGAATQVRWARASGTGTAGAAYRVVGQ